MSLLYNSYEQTWSKLLTFAWDDPTATVFIQLLDGSYSYSKTHTKVIDFDGFEVGTPVTLTGKTISSAGALSCNDISFGSQTLDPVFAVIYYSSGGETSVDDLLLFHIRLNDGDSLAIRKTRKLVLNNLLSWQTASLGLC